MAELYLKHCQPLESDRFTPRYAAEGAVKRMWDELDRDSYRLKGFVKKELIPYSCTSQDDEWAAIVAAMDDVPLEYLKLGWP